MRITDGAVYIAGEVLQSSCAVCVPERAIAKDSTCMYMYTISSFSLCVCVYIYISRCARSVCVPERAIAKDSTCMYMCTISSALYIFLFVLGLSAFLVPASGCKGLYMHVYVHSFFFFFFSVCIYFFLCLVCPMIIKTVVVAVPPNGKNRKFLESSVTVFGAVAYQVF